MPMWLQIIIVSSTIGGLGFAAFGMWLDAKQKQAKMGSSVDELRAVIEEQREQLMAADRRFQNLETIVTSQVWDIVHDDGLSEKDRQRALSEARTEMDLTLDSPSSSDDVAQIARRLRS